MNILRKFFKTKPKDCVCYYRNSRNSKQQYHRQDFVCRQFCTEKGIEIKNTFSEVISGNATMENREAFIQAISYCLNHKIRTIVISEVDRFSRNIHTANDLVGLLKAAKINLISVFENLTLEKNEKEILDIVAMSNRELNVIYNRLNTGRKKALEDGRCKLGRRVGYRKTREQFENEYRNVLEELREGNSVRKTAQKTGVSESTVQRLKKDFNIEKIKKSKQV